jgi:hypothetical protein
MCGALAIAMRFLTVPCALALLLASSVALAEEPPSAPPSTVAPPATQSEWYGWQPLLADGAFVGTLILVSHTNGKIPPALDYVLPIEYLVASPIIHFAHERPGTAVGSLLLRLGVPVAGGFLGYASCSNHDDGGVAGAVGALAGVGLGMIGAMIIDDAALARHDVPIRPTEEGLTVHPSAVATRGGAMVGLGGSF